MPLASAGNNHVPAIAQLVQADKATVRDVIRQFDWIGLARLDPQWAGGRPRLPGPRARRQRGPGESSRSRY